MGLHKGKSNTGSIKKGEHRSKKTEFKKGKSPVNGFKKGNIPWNKGKNMGRPWNYKGVTPLNKLLRRKSMWKIWREAVYLRDNFTCQNKDCEFCNNKIGVLLHPHHIKPMAEFPELVFNIDNGITYCAEFHLKGKLHLGIQKNLRRIKK